MSVLSGLVVLAALPWPLSRFFERDSEQYLLDKQSLSEVADLFRDKDGHYARHFLNDEHRFRDAAWRFWHLEVLGLNNPALCCNQGNAWLLGGDLPQAILAYRRGLRLDPGHRRLQENLAYARNHVRYPMPELRPAGPAWPPSLPFPSPDLVLLLALVVYGFACVSFTCWRIVHRGLLRTALLGGLAVALAISAWLLLQQQIADPGPPLVVIRLDKTPFRLGNGASYFARHPDVPDLPRGLEARRLHQRGEWLQIELASGHIGWVQHQDVIVDQLPKPSDLP